MSSMQDAVKKAMLEAMEKAMQSQSVQVVIAKEEEKREEEKCRRQDAEAREKAERRKRKKATARVKTERRKREQAEDEAKTEAGKRKRAEDEARVAKRARVEAEKVAGQLADVSDRDKRFYQSTIRGHKRQIEYDDKAIRAQKRRIEEDAETIREEKAKFMDKMGRAMEDIDALEGENEAKDETIKRLTQALRNHLSEKQIQTLLREQDDDGPALGGRKVYKQYKGAYVRVGKGGKVALMRS